MKLRPTKSVLLGLLLLSALRPVQAQTTYTPVVVTGFTDDIVANGSGPALNSTTNAADQGTVGVRYCFVAPTYISPSGATPIASLPASGLVNSVLTPGLTFQLATYAGANSLRITGTGAGSLLLATPQAAQSVWVAGTTGNGESNGTPVSMTVVFTDGTTQTFSNNVPDWFGGTGFAIEGVSRVNRDTDAFDNAFNEPKIYQFQLVLLPANYAKLVQGVTFAKTQPIGAAVLNIFNGMAVTLSRVCSLPAGSIAAVPNAVCPGTVVPLSMVQLGIGYGYAGQWQASVDGGLTWTDVAGATAPAYSPAPLVTTRYRYRAACGALQGFIGPVTITVAVPTAAVAYDNAAYCRTGRSAAPVATPLGGSFAAPAGLVLDLSTGVIDLAASTAGTYAVGYTGPGRCPATAITTVLIKSDALPVFPNIITPNGDGRNDALHLLLSDVTDYRLRVFSRWGRRVYESRDAGQGWTALDNSPGPYLYLVEYSDCAGHRQLYKGWVDVVK